jgi:putative heme-binding domain-containing protein
MRADLAFRRNIGLAVMTLLLVPACVAQLAGNSTSADEGHRTYSASCAGCHGLDGRGTDKAINIAGSPSVQNLTDAQLAGIISEGVIEEGMPAFRSLNESQLHTLVAYVRILQGKSQATALPGDPKRGQEIFFGKGGCGQCHTVAGRGGFLGPDLTNHAATSSVDAIRDEIVRSPRMPAPRYRMAVLTTIAGDRIEGLIRNEDNFSIQLQATDGTFHLFRKSNLKTVEYSTRALMPTDYRKRMSDSDLKDLASYLLTTPENKTGLVPQKKWDEDEE